MLYEWINRIYFSVYNNNNNNNVAGYLIEEAADGL